MKKQILLIIAALPIALISVGLSLTSDRDTKSYSQDVSPTVKPKPLNESRPPVRGVIRGGIQRRLNRIHIPPKASTVRNWVRMATYSSVNRSPGQKGGRLGQRNPRGTDPILRESASGQVKNK